MPAGSKVVLYEKAFLTVGGILLAVCLVALTIGSVAMGISLPGRVAQIDPAAVPETPPFDRPGVRQIGPNHYEAVVISFAWGFTPNRIVVPVGADITFTATSRDVIHGFHIEATRLNMMLIPGQVAQNRYRFERPGEYQIICHEYCGAGHHVMFGRVIVVGSADEMEEENLGLEPAPDERPSIEPDSSRALPADPTERGAAAIDTVAGAD